MDFLKIILLSFGSLVTLFLLSKIMGCKQISQMTPYDYIIGISIGSIAAEMATSLDDSFAEPLTAMVIYALSTFILSYLSKKSVFWRRIFAGKSLIVFYDGNIYRSNLKKARLDVNGFLLQCRAAGYFDLSKLKAAIFEPNGKISFLPKGNEQPLTATAMNMAVSDDEVRFNLIVDGTVLYDTLRLMGKDEKWLLKKLKEKNISKIDDVFLAYSDLYGRFDAFRRFEPDSKHDISL